MEVDIHQAWLGLRQGRLARGAETAEEARELLAACHGHRCHVDDRVHLEVHRVKDR